MCVYIYMQIYTQEEWRGGLFIFIYLQTNFFIFALLFLLFPFLEKLWQMKLLNIIDGLKI